MKRLMSRTFVALTLAAGCGGGSEGDSDTTTTGVSTTQTATEGTTDETTGDAETGSESDATGSNSMTEGTGSESETDGTTDTDTAGPTTDGMTTDDPTDATTDGPTTTTNTTSNTTLPDPTDGVPCEDFDVMTSVPVTPNVMLVLDKSGSMFINTWDHDNDGNTPQISRWNSLHNVVTFILSNFDDGIAFGAQLYPSIFATNSYSQAGCNTLDMPEVPVAENNQAAILAGIPTATDTDQNGGTPASLGMISALTHLDSLDPEIPKAVILVTDGAANCTPNTNTPALFEDYDEGLHDLVSDAFMIDGIPTYVVGIDIQNVTSPSVQDGAPDNTNPFDRLNELAEDGGVPQMGTEKFYNSSNEIDLQNALNEIATDVQSCVVPLGNEPPEPDKVKIFVNDNEVPQVMDCENEDGWIWSVEFTEVTLCGTYCEELKETGSLNAEFYCTPG